MDKFELTPLGKLFVASLVAWINNDAKLNWKINGTPEQVKAFVDAVIAAKKFQEETQKQSVTVDDIISLLNAKSAAAQEFEKVTGKNFPL